MYMEFKHDIHYSGLPEFVKERSIMEKDQAVW